LSLAAQHLADGDRHFTSGRLTEALAAYERAIAAEPDLVEARFNRAVVLARQGRADDAHAGFLAALSLRPRWPAGLLALGHLEFHRARFADAAACFAQAAAASPDSAEAHCNLGLARLRLMQPGHALPALRRARELAPEREEPWAGLRRALMMLGRADEACADFVSFEARARPSAALIAAALESARMVPGDALERRYLPLALQWRWRVADLEALSGVVGLLPYFDVSREAVATLGRTYDTLAQTSRADVADLAQPPLEGASGQGASGQGGLSRGAPGRLRIGYLSADLREHVMGRIVEEILARHDASAFEVRLYSLAPPGGEDALTGRLRARAAGFVRLAGLADYEAARAIAADRLHVLVDLMGHTSWSQPGILLFKPAPVIVTHLGYHGRVGLRQVDFKVTDAVADLPDAGAFQIERPLAMEGSVIPIRRIATPAGGERRGRAGVAFGAFVSLEKTSPRCLAAWKRILDRVPGATVVFSPHHEWQRERFRQRLASFGIATDRVGFLPRPATEAEGRLRYRDVDAMLDAFPYVGGDSAATALAEGVPFVTLCGQRHSERVAASVLTHLGVEDTIAWSEDEYEELAVRLALDRGWRDDIAARIRAALPSHDVAMNAYTRRLETALVEAWRQRGGAAP
jgi:predicted O-linked N-acetylglucosamine transferase (SPINDLY family)